MKVNKIVKNLIKGFENNLNNTYNITLLYELFFLLRLLFIAFETTLTNRLLSTIHRTICR